MKFINYLFILTVACTMGCATQEYGQASTNNFANQSVETIKSDITGKHPLSYIILASKLFEQQKYDDAVLWYYIGQIRYRAYLKSNPNLEPSGDPALYSSLKYVVGTPINQQAGSNPDNWAAIVGQALEWHSNNKNSFTPKSEYPAIYNEIENEFKEFQNYILSNKEEIRKQRVENGLDNS